MHNRLFKYIWQHSSRQQVGIVLWTCLSFPLLYLSLEIPKIIINEALSGDRSRFELLGYALDPVGFLVVLCLVLLTLIVINGLLKMRINTLKGIIGERLIRRLRYELIQRIFRFPVAHLARSSQGEFIASITGETEPLAGYISESVALPLFQGGTMLTILIFMFAQDWVFGVASVALIPVQGYIIPKLQKQVNALKKERITRVRKLSERVGETISGAQEIRLQGTQRYALAEFSHWLGGLFNIRLQIFRKKFFMKFLNNTIGQVTPFLFYLLGGYLVINGELTIGALVAALAAYKDLTAPWKELLNHYQVHADAKIKYAQILEQFSPAGLLKDHAPSSEQSLDSLLVPIRLNDVGWTSESGEQAIAELSFAVQPGSQIAILGENAVQRMRLAQLLTGLEKPTSGTITIGDVPIDSVDPDLLRRGLAYQGPDPHFFNGTIQQNIVYGLYHKPPLTAGDDDPVVAESVASGNSVDDYAGDWIDYQMIGVDSEKNFEEHYLQGALAVGSEKIMYQRGLSESIDPGDYPELADRLLKARTVIRDKILREGLQRVVSEFDPELYNRHATVAENILFGIPASSDLNIAAIAEHPHLQETLERVGLLDEVLGIGRRLMLRIARGARKNREERRLLTQFGVESPERAAEIARIASRDPDGEKADQYRGRFIETFLHLIPELHPFAKLDKQVVDRLLQARYLFNNDLPSDLQGEIILFDRNHVHPRLSIHDNLLFGRMVSRDPAAEKRVRDITDQTLEDMALRRAVMLQMTQSQVGVSGQRLPATARHGIAVSRMLIKRPDVMIFHDAMSPFSERERSDVRSNIREMLPESTMIWIDRDLPGKAGFDLVLQLSESGGIKELTPTSASNQFDTDILTVIGRSSVCGKLGASHQELIAEASSQVTVDAEEFVYLAGNTATHAYIIVEGEARAYRDPEDLESVASVLGPGETFGMMELISERNTILSVRAEQPLKLLQINGEAIQDIVEGDLSVMQVMLRGLIDQWAGASRGKRVY